MAVVDRAGQTPGQTNLNHEFISQLDEYIKIKRYRLVNSVVVYENDELVFERYYNKFTENTPNDLMSVWKSILSIILGICFDIGLCRKPISTHQFCLQVYIMVMAFFGVCQKMATTQGASAVRILMYTLH